MDADTIPPHAQPLENPPRPPRFKQIAIVFLIVLAAAAALFVLWKRQWEMRPAAVTPADSTKGEINRFAPIEKLDPNLFQWVEKDIGTFSEDASFFDEEESNLEEINASYEDQ